VFPSRYDHRDLARPSPHGRAHTCTYVERPASRPELENRTVANVLGYQKYPSSPRSISTGPLHASLRFYGRPIKLVVFQRSYSLKEMGELISRWASRLDAFSGYPVQT
jgi:hypothetical protein